MAAPPDWTTLRILLASIELGSVTKAADRLGIAVSAAAKRVQMLEADLRLPLLERGARGVKPTPAGEVFTRYASALIDLAGRLGSDLKAFAAGGLGSVRLAATPSLLCGSELAEGLGRFAIQRPGIQVELREDTSLAILRDMAEGRIDLGLITTSARLPQGLEAHAWGHDRLLMVVSQNHALASRASMSFGEVLDHPLIGVLEGGAITLLLDEAAQNLGRRPNYRFRVTSTDAARRLVAAGHGGTVMPDGVLRGYEEALGLRGIKLTDRWARRQLRLVTRPTSLLPPPAQLLRDFLLGPGRTTQRPRGADAAAAS